MWCKELWQNLAHMQATAHKFSAFWCSISTLPGKVRQTCSHYKCLHRQHNMVLQENVACELWAEWAWHRLCSLSPHHTWTFQQSCSCTEANLVFTIFQNCQNYGSASQSSFYGLLYLHTGLPYKTVVASGLLCLHTNNTLPHKATTSSFHISSISPFITRSHLISCYVMWVDKITLWKIKKHYDNKPF